MNKAIYYHNMGPAINYLDGGEVTEPTPNIEKWKINRIKKRLKKLGIDSYLHRREVVMIRFDTQKISDAIMEMDANLQRLFFEPHYVLMGVMQFKRLVCEQRDQYMPYVSYKVPIDLHMRDGRFRYRIAGIEIKVVPGFDGIALIPEGI